MFPCIKNSVFPSAHLPSLNVLTWQSQSFFLLYTAALKIYCLTPNHILQCPVLIEWLSDTHANETPFYHNQESEYVVNEMRIFLYCCYIIKYTFLLNLIKLL